MFGWDADTWLAVDHIAPTPLHPGARGIIDQMLDEMGLPRNIAARCAHFSLIPDMVASSLLVMTTGRQYCERFTQRLPVSILECPISLPRLEYYQLWHERTHSSASARWLSERIKAVAASLRPASAATQDPSQEGGPLSHGSRRLGAGAIGRQPLLVGPEPLRRDVGRAAVLQQHQAVLRLVDRPPGPGPPRHLPTRVERTMPVTIVTGIDRMV